MKSQLF